MHSSHQVKAGVEFRAYRLDLSDITIRFDRDTGWKPFVDPVTTFNNNQYVNEPREFSVYLQDKIEWQDMIVNAGLRFDWFDPNGVVPEELRDPKNSTRHREDKKVQFSPRFGIAYPITDRGVIHASYGHFFQMPAFDFLYQNSEFEIFPGRLASKIGNADLEPERTIASDPESVFLDNQTDPPLETEKRVVPLNVFQYR